MQEKVDNRFNLLYLEYQECLFNSITAYRHKNDESLTKIDYGRLHVNSHSIVFDSGDIFRPLIKLTIDDSFVIKIYKLDEIVKLFEKAPESNRERNLPTLTNQSVNSSNVTSPKVGKKTHVLSNSTSDRAQLRRSTSLKVNKELHLDIDNFDTYLETVFTFNTDDKVNRRKSVKYTLNEFSLSSELPLLSYFSEHNINFSQFLELFSSVWSMSVQGGDKLSSTFALVLIKASSYRYIDRVNFKYEDSNCEVSKKSSYLFIIKGSPLEVDSYLNDVFVFTEAITNHREDENGLINIVSNRKIEEIKSKLNAEDYFFVSPSTRIRPEKFQNGLFVIYKNSTCSFIPVNNNIDKTILSFRLSDVKCFTNFRFLYQNKAINLYLHNNPSLSLLFDFETEVDQQFVIEYFTTNCSKLDKSFLDVKYHTNLWVDGLMTNYDYLVYLNTIAGRSTSDLSQYPVMPWALTNYTDENINLNDARNFRDLSKPVGALNATRLQNIKEKYEELRDQGREFQYLYRNYISFPFVVFYYLMRTHPFYFLRYQGGNFGPPDRLFYSVEECWNTTYTNLGLDVKELIPEFYSGNGDFLKNFNHLQLGKTQSNTQVNDVILPKWAGSPSEFIKIMRAALESEYVSNSLHLWIDLIFGYKQRGLKAEEANNLYYFLRYDDCIEIFDKVEDDRQSDIDDILECGQVPLQVFIDPHPKKRSRIVLKEIKSGDFSLGIEVLKQKKERIKIEKRYEKERREKEANTEMIERILKDKEKQYNKQLEMIEELIKKKEIEFRLYVESLIKRNVSLKSSFNEYDTHKEEVLNKLIKEIRQKHDKHIESLFGENKNLYKHIKNLQSVEEKYESKRKQMEKKISELNKEAETETENHKKLKELLYSKQKSIRSIPHELQIHLTKHVDQDS